MAATTQDQVIALLRELQVNTKTIVTVVPSDAAVINVDLNTRTIDLAKSAYSKFLSVAYDHYAETIYFKVPRYFDGVDLSHMTCVIEYINARGDNRISPILVRDIISDPNYMVFGWCIHGDATRKAGTIQFAIRFYSIDLNTHEFLYSLRTQQATGRILHGMDDAPVAPEQSLLSHTVEEIAQSLQDCRTIYWTVV